MSDTADGPIVDTTNTWWVDGPPLDPTYEPGVESIIEDAWGFCHPQLLDELFRDGTTDAHDVYGWAAFAEPDAVPRL